MIGYVANIQDLTEKNTDFRRVLYSGTKLQLVVMSMKPGEELGGEIHAETDQVFCITDGKGMVVIDGAPHKVKSGDCAVVPAGAHHNVICAGHHPLKLFTIYGPPHHRDQLVQKNKADVSNEAYAGKASEHEAEVLQV